MKISVLILAFKILFSTPHGTWYGNRGRGGCNGPGSLGGHGPRLFYHISAVVKCYHWFANYKTNVIIGCNGPDFFCKLHLGIHGRFAAPVSATLSEGISRHLYSYL